MNIEYLVRNASGTGLKNCHFLALRNDIDDEECIGDCFVVRRYNDRVQTVVGTSGFYYDLWRSPTGAVYVAGDRSVHWSSNPVQNGGQWDVQRDTISRGIWGLDDTFVLTWGDTIGKTMYRFDGTSWRSMQAPGWVLEVHGLTPELVVAVGKFGISRFDGHTWVSMNTGEYQGDFIDVHVVSEDEMYAILDHRQVWEGSIHGWSPMTEEVSGRNLHCVAKWRDKIWVGDSASGLSVINGNELEVVKPNLLTTKFDTREDLLITHKGGIAATSDGTNYKGFGIDTIADLLSGERPKWF